MTNGEFTPGGESATTQPVPVTPAMNSNAAEQAPPAEIRIVHQRPRRYGKKVIGAAAGAALVGIAYSAYEMFAGGMPQQVASPEDSQI